MVSLHIFMQHLTPNQQRIRDMLDAGKSIWNICGIMRMRREHVEEEIYEIRRKEAIMARKPKFNKEQRAEMLRLHNEERYSVGKLASKFGCSQTAVKTALQAAKIEAEEETMKNTGINPEFDAAVDAMIAESKAADAEERSAIAEPEAEAQDESEPLPPVVRRAVDGHLTFIADRIEALQYRISEIEIEIEEYRKDASRLEEWKEQQKWR